MHKRLAFVWTVVLAATAADLGAQTASGAEAAEAEIDNLTKKNAQLTSRLLEMERSYEQLRDKFAAIQGEATAFAEQMSDARLNLRDVELRYKEVQEANEALSEENRRLSKDLARTKDEILKQNVMIDVLQQSGGSDEASPGAEKQLRTRIAELEATLASQQAERIELLKRVEAMRLLLPEGQAGSMERYDLPSGLYRNDPSGLAAEVSGFVSGRLGGLLRGAGVWDGADFVLIFGCLGAAGACAWLVFAWRRRQFLAGEVRDLREKMRQLETGRESDRPRRARDREANEGSGTMPRPSGAGFSAVLMTSDDAEDDDEPDATEVLSPLLGATGPASKSSSNDADRPVRHVIGAHQWSDADDDEAGHTQVIEGVSEISLSSLSAGILRKKPLVVDDDDDDFGNTQIISSLSDLESLDGEPTVQIAALPGLSSSSDDDDDADAARRDLMGELEDLIERKVDEMIQ